MVPDHSAISYQTADEYEDLLDLNTEASILQYMQILGPRLASKDANWGYLTKTAGEKHLTLPNGQFISVDSFCYRPTDGVVDCITNAVESTPAGPSWGEKPKRADNHWYPIGGTTPVPPSQDCNCQEEIQHLQNQINDLYSKLNQPVSLTGRKIALQAETNDKWVCADKNMKETPLVANRPDAGPWETFKILEK